jgi:cytochrome oxidase Cu insertion factor (SCO1/SenC/PrrC family)
MTDTTAPARRKPWPVILLALLFIGPLAAAWIVYFAAPDWRPSGQANYGELIDPPVSLPDLALIGPDGQPLGDAPLRQRWTLIYVDDSGCGESCRQTLFDTYQVRYLLHRDLDRVRRILLYTGAPPDPAFVAEQHPDLLVADATGGDAPALIEALPAPAVPGNAVYLVDPLGNLMMRYPATGSWQDMHKDLKKLLKLSRIG